MSTSNIEALTSVFDSVSAQIFYSDPYSNVNFVKFDWQENHDHSLVANTFFTHEAQNDFSDISSVVSSVKLMLLIPVNLPFYGKSTLTYPGNNCGDDTDNEENDLKSEFISKELAHQLQFKMKYMPGLILETNLDNLLKSLQIKYIHPIGKHIAWFKLAVTDGRQNRAEPIFFSTSNFNVNSRFTIAYAYSQKSQTLQIFWPSDYSVDEIYLLYIFSKQSDKIWLFKAVGSTKPFLKVDEFNMSADLTHMLRHITSNGPLQPVFLVKHDTHHVSFVFGKAFQLQL